jgi:hypothetical protein
LLVNIISVCGQCFKTFFAVIYAIIDVFAYDSDSDADIDVIAGLAIDKRSTLICRCVIKNVL